MRIIFCISSLGSGGAERALSDLANYYASNGHSVHILTLVSTHVKPFYYIDSRVNLIQTDKSSKGNSSVIKRFYNILSSFLEIRTTVKNLKADVVVSFIDLMNVRVLLSCLGLKVPVIVSERTDPSHHKLPLKKISEWLRLKLYPKASKLVVQTKVAAQYFPSDWQESISIIPNAVRKPSVKWINNSNEIKKIISVGRLSKEKNHKELIIAFSEWVKDYPSLVLNIYGEGPEKENLERLILNLGLSCCVKLCGTVNNVQEVLVSSDLFVFPSIYEGFPNALCEALAIGLPVVASDCSGNAEVIEHGINGLLFRVNDRKSLTKCVLSLLNDKEKVETLSSNASKITDRLSPEVVYSLWDSIIFKSAFI